MRNLYWPIDIYILISRKKSKFHYFEKFIVIREGCGIMVLFNFYYPFQKFLNQYVYNLVTLSIVVVPHNYAKWFLQTDVLTFELHKYKTLKYVPLLF